MAAALAAPVALGALGKSIGGCPRRLRRHVVLVAALHLRRHLPRADRTRDVLARLTGQVERTVTRCRSARGVNAKFIQRDPFCDAIYRRLRGLAPRAPWPRSPGGGRMTRAEVESEVAQDRWWSSALEGRRDAIASQSDDDLERLRDALAVPMPLPERIRTFAPPLVAPARIPVDRAIRGVDDETLAVLHRDCRRRLVAARSALRDAVVERARRLAVIHRRRHGLD